MKNLGLASMWAVSMVAGLACAKTDVVGRQDAGPDVARSEPDAAVGWVLDVASKDVAGPNEEVACSRSVSLTGVTIARPVPFDVVIVSDNSDSLSWSRDSLSSGLKNLLGRVRGHEARFFVLSTTQYGASSEAAVSALTGKDLVGWQDSVSGAAYANAMTAYEQVCVDGSGARIECPKGPLSLAQGWKVTGTWRFQRPPPVAAITPTMDASQIAAQQKLIADAILGQGGGGSQQEQPVCTLLRYIGQDPTVLPKHAIFVVLSDEDDTSPPEACLASYEAIHQVGLSGSKVVCDSDCPEYVYLVNRRNQEEHLDFFCVPVDDKGTAHPEQATQKTVVTKPSTMCSSSSTAVACTDAELARATGECGAGYLVRSCTRSCAEGKSYVQCNLSRTDNKTDLCTQPFDQNGAHYANLTDYCARTTGGTGWETCAIMGLKPSTADGGTSSSSSEHTSPVVAARNTAEMISSFKNTADRLIGQGNYSVEAVVLDPTFNCPLHPGQSYATNLRSLASSAHDVFALCEDYAPAIEGIVTFAEYLIQTDYPLALDAYEDIDSVLVTNKQGEQRAVAAQRYTYDRSGGTLRFEVGILTAEDEKLAVNVARYCAPIIL
jgi:hypothetical protein